MVLLAGMESGRHHDVSAAAVRYHYHIRDK